MQLEIEKRLIPRHFTKGNGREIKYIVIHYFGSLGTARAVANYFAATENESSAHYCVDEGNVVYQCVEDGDIAWHCGTKGAYLHPECRNANSIGIEARPCKLDVSTASSAMERDWYFTDEVTANLITLTQMLMEKYAIPPERVVRHYDVTGKWCPRPWMGEDINEYWGTSGDGQWAKFKAALTEERPEEEETTEIRYERLTDIPERDGFRAIVEELMNAGIIKGDGSDREGNNDIIDLSHDMVRLLVFHYRAGLYDGAIARGNEQN